MRKILISLVLAIGCWLLAARPAAADVSVAEASAVIKISGNKSDYRVRELSNFLKEFNSPLAPYAQKFVEEADKNGLDFRLVPAITGVESTFGKRIPYNSYNAYGWAGGLYRFDSWENSIEIVSKSLKEDYVDKGANSIFKIGRWYCPPNDAWAWNVKSFMEKIQPSYLAFTLES